MDDPKRVHSFALEVEWDLSSCGVAGMICNESQLLKLKNSLILKVFLFLPWKSGLKDERACGRRGTFPSTPFFFIFIREPVGPSSA